MITLPCPHCQRPIPLGAMMSALSKGRPKHYTSQQISALTARLAEARKKRWPSKIAVDTAPSSDTVQSTTQ